MANRCFSPLSAGTPALTAHPIHSFYMGGRESGSRLAVATLPSELFGTDRRRTKKTSDKKLGLCPRALWAPLLFLYHWSSTITRIIHSDDMAKKGLALQRTGAYLGFDFPSVLGNPSSSSCFPLSLFPIPGFRYVCLPTKNTALVASQYRD